MKLRFFDVERFGIWNALDFGGFAEGLTVIYGPNGSGKTTLLQFVRAMLYGRPASGDPRALPAIHEGRQGGRLGLTARGSDCVLKRVWDVDGPESLAISAADSAGGSTLTVEQLLGDVTAEAFNSVFTVGQREAGDLDSIIREALACEELTESDIEQPETVRDAISRLDGANEEIPRLEAEQQRLQSEISELLSRENTPPTELKRVRQDMERLHKRAEELQAHVAQADSEISRIRSLPTQDHDRPATFSRFERLEQQIARWRVYRAEIDDQLAEIASENHVLSLQSDATESAGAETQLRAARQTLTAVEDQLGQLRSDGSDRGLMGQLSQDLSVLQQTVFELCDRLSQLQVAATSTRLEAEATQLRRCRTEIDRQLTLMLARRRLLLAECERSAPELSASERHDRTALCDSAAHRAQLQAEREQSSPMHLELDALLANRKALAAELETAREQLANLDELRRQLVRLVGEPQAAARLEQLRLDLNIVRERLQKEREEAVVRSTTRHLLEGLEADYESKQRPRVLAEASEYLRRLSGEMPELLASADGQTVLLKQQDGQTRPLLSLSSGERDQVALCLRLALVNSYARRGVSLPLILDDVFITADSEASVAAARLLKEFASEQRQVIFLTCHRHIAAMFRDLGTPVLDLPAARRPLPEPTQQQRSTLPATDDSLIVKAFRSEIEELTDRTPVPSPETVATENWLFYTELESPLNVLDGVTTEHVEALTSQGISSVEDLLTAAPDAVEQANCGVTAAEVRVWQTQALLSCRVPMLRSVDAALLVACGITTPERLAEIHPGELFEAIQFYVKSADGSRFRRANNPVDAQTAINWVRCAAHARSLWHAREPRRAHAERRSEPLRVQERHTESREAADPEAGAAEQGDALSTTVVRRRSSRRSSRAKRRGSRTRLQRETSRRERSDDATDSTPDRATRIDSAKSESERRPKFYLSRRAPVEDAPSIGPRTAGHLAKVSIITVDDLLSARPDEAAEELGHKRIKGDTIREWQDQARLVCRIPGLRGHDAQILVALDVRSPEQLAAYRPADLFAEVAPFVETSEGERIIRNGRKPDFEEVTFWIDCAKQSRELRAA